MAGTAVLGAAAGMLSSEPAEAAAPDYDWDERFGHLGLNGNVYAIAVSGNDVYVGGEFTTAGGVSASRVAKWNGSAWSPLGSGVDNTVLTIAISGTEVYVGGMFTHAGGEPANRIAKWNGSTWSPLSTGMDDWVRTIAISGADVYAGGDFLNAGGARVNFVAKWNGSTWSGLGSGMSDSVRTIAIGATGLYAGGDFLTAGGVSADHIAKWNGSTWSDLRSGADSWVRTIAVGGTDQYAGGDFLFAGGTSANYIAKWNGSTWSPLDTGVVDWVRAIAISGTGVYAGGDFVAAGGTPANHIAKWDGTAWSPLRAGTNGWVRAIAVRGDEVYVGGDFTSAGGKPSMYFGRWVRQADLQVAKHAAPNPVNAGAQLTSTLVITNAGPGIATNVVATDTLPSGVALGSVTASQGTCAVTGTITCTLGAMPVNTTARITVVVTTSAPATLSNTAGVTGGEPDPSLANNAASATTAVRPVADLAIVKSASPNPVTAGNLLTYTFAVTNTGPWATTDVVVSDTLPAGATLGSATASQGSCTGTGVVTCALGTLPLNGTARITITAIPTVAGIITNTATVESYGFDPNTGNNTASATTMVSPAANLVITRPASTDYVTVGNPLTYTVAVTNTGPSTATGVVLTETLASGVTLASATASQGNCSGTSTVVCTMGALPVGSSGRVTIAVTATAIGTITATGSVAGAEFDPDPANNVASTSTVASLRPQTDPLVTRLTAPVSVTVGAPVTYTLVVTNAGPSAVSNVLVTDTLPGNVTFGAAMATQGTCSGTSTVTCALGTLGVNATAQVTIVVTTTAAGTIANTASVVPAGTGPTSSSNTTSVTTTASPPSTPSATPTVAPATATPTPVVTATPPIVTATKTPTPTTTSVTSPTATPVRTPTATPAASATSTPAISPTPAQTGATISGVVKTADGKILTGIRAQVLAQSATGWAVADVDPTTGRYAIRVKDGQSVYIGITVELNQGYRWMPGQMPELRIPAGATAVTYDFALVRTDGTVAGQVTDPTGKPLGGAYVSVSLPPSGMTPVRYVDGVQTGPDGTYRMSVQSGKTYRVRVTAPTDRGFISPPEQTCIVLEGGACTAHLRLLSANSTLSGSVSGGSAFNGTVGARAIVRAWSDRGGSALGRTDASGRYVLRISNGGSTGDTWHVGAVYHANGEYAASLEMSVPVSAAATSYTRDLALGALQRIPEGQSVTFNANERRVIELANGVRITIPAGALATTGQVTVRVVPNPTLPSEQYAHPLDIGYSLEAIDGAGTPITKFNANVTIEIPYDESRIPSGLTEDDLIPAFSDPATGTWRPAEKVTIDKAGNRAVILTDHFSDFAIVHAGRPQFTVYLPTWFIGVISSGW